MNADAEDTELAAAISDGGPLEFHQRLSTSGARAVCPFELDGQLFLVVPQLAKDVAGHAAYMNAGDSDVDAIIYAWKDGRFVEHDRLPTPGGEDALVFNVASETFLATASVRTGSDPYDLNAFGDIHRREAGRWVLLQRTPTFAAKQWAHFAFDGRDFLALAQGVTVPGAEPRHPRQSRILEWDGRAFKDFQILEGCWGYNWAFFELDGQRFLAYADHTSPSLLYRWDGAAFIAHQVLADRGGRAFQFFERDGQAWLVVAVIDGETTLFRWTGKLFEAHQRLGGPGGREFELFETARGLHLVRICFIEGAPTQPKTDLKSQVYRWDDGQFTLVQEFATFGGTDAATFRADGELFLAVSNSLTADVRFRQDSAVYRIATT